MRAPQIKIGSAERFKNITTANETPGAIYNPSFPLHRPNLPKFSFGKVPGKNKVGRDVEIGCTPPNIGPNSYFKKGYPEVMVRKSQPIHKVPTALRSTEWVPKGVVNETYEQ
jgi:hypothetical protein